MQQIENSINRKLLGLNLHCSFAQDISFVEKLKGISNEPLERVVKRLVLKEGFTHEQAQAARIDFLRFISLRFITSASTSPSSLADEFWHAFILHTRDYNQFCLKHFGEFLHHEPFDDYVQAEPGIGMRTKNLLNVLYPNKLDCSKEELCVSSLCIAFP